MLVEFIYVIISPAILFFAAMLMAEIFHRIKLPIVLGELLAGIIVGPFALGGLYLVDREPLVTLYLAIRQVGEIAAIVILFTGGVNIMPREFLKGGAAALIFLVRRFDNMLEPRLCKPEDKSARSDD